MKIILIGIQGSGKSTQGIALSKKLGVPYLSTGHIFREMAKEKTPLGREIKLIINAGVLISDQKTLLIVSEYLSRPEYVKGYIIDGFPRTINQVENFSNGVDKVFYIKISDKETLWRIFGRQEVREDETMLAIRRRIDLFHKFTEPVVEYYRHKGILVEINGEQPIKAITAEILKALGKE
jgi:adenylate kinase